MKGSAPAPLHGGMPLTPEGAVGIAKPRRRRVGLLVAALAAVAAVAIASAVILTKKGGSSSGSASGETPDGGDGSEGEVLKPPSVITAVPGTIRGADYWYLKDVVKGGGPKKDGNIIDVFDGETYTYAIKVASAGSYNVTYNIAASPPALTAGINSDGTQPIKLFVVGASGSCESPQRAMLALPAYSTGSLDTFESQSGASLVSFEEAGQTALTVCVTSGKRISIESIELTRVGEAGPATSLKAPVSGVPGDIASSAFANYIDTPGYSYGPLADNGDIISVSRGEAVTYQVDVARAGNYKVSYSFSSKPDTDPGNVVVAQVHLAPTGNCGAESAAPLTLRNFSTGSWVIYQAFEAEDSVKLSAGTQNVTMCFDEMAWWVAFHLMTFSVTDKEAPAATAPAEPVEADGDGCFGMAAWQSANGEVLLNGRAFHIKGANWYGFETNLFNVQGVWSVPMGDILDILQKEKVNALRIPVSLQLALDKKILLNPDGCGYQACVESRLAWDQMGMLFDEAAQRGMLIMLDMHCLIANGNLENPLWYDDDYSEADFVRGWKNLLDEFGSRPNLFAIDLYNEPHAEASWGAGQPETDWGLAAVRTIRSLHKTNPDYTGLFLVQGVEMNVQTPYIDADAYEFEHWWGGNLDGLYSQPINAAALGGSEAMAKRVVISPHQYGPSVWPNQSYFFDPAFPENMASVWDLQLGFVSRVSGGRAVVMGEWGGSYIGDDKQLQNQLVEYLRENCISDGFWWAINPTSADTGGLLLDNWKSVDAGKFKAMERLQPYPSLFTDQIRAGKFCVDFGAYANYKCAPSS